VAGLGMGNPKNLGLESKVPVLISARETRTDFIFKSPNNKGLK
jgi:hypothetical protein